MPYIKQEDRRRLFNDTAPETPGELNYLITTLVHQYLSNNPNYQRYNDAIGALECAKLELYRRKIADYEDFKIKENGDV